MANGKKMASAHFLTLRRASWLIFAIGTVAPVVWGRYQLEAFNNIRPAPSCGMPVLGIFGAAALVIAVSSLIAGGLGSLAYFRQARTRKFIRKVEIALLALPAIAGILLLLDIMTM